MIHIPELLHLVCSYSRPVDLIPLCQACRQVFYGVIPFIWETTDGIDKILALLPNAVINHPRLVELPSIEDTSFERFDIYALHVKYLEIYSENVQGFDPSGWKVLTDRSRTRSLLPNLRSLTVHKYMTDPQHEDDLEWITSFIGPSLRTFWYQLHQHELQVARMPKVPVIVLLDPLVERCFALERLAIFPKAGSRTCFDLAAILGSRSFSYLRELSGSAAFVAADVLPVIGALPHLERLSVRAYEQFFPNLPESLSSDAFPALSHFALSTNNPQDALELGRFPPLVSNLKHLDFRCDFYAYDGVLWDVETFSLEIICSWLDSIASLASLRMDFDPEGNGYDSVNFTNTPVLERIIRHRIESLYFNGAHFEPYDVFVTSQEDWSFLKQLHMPGYQVLFATLDAFTYAPNLEHLTASLVFTDIHTRTRQFVPSSSMQIIECTVSGIELFAIDDLDIIAWRLLSMWPKLQEVRCTEDLMFHGSPFVQLNEYIAFLKESLPS